MVQEHFGSALDVDPRVSEILLVESTFSELEMLLGSTVVAEVAKSA